MSFPGCAIGLFVPPTLPPTTTPTTSYKDAQSVIDAIQATGATLTTTQKDACNARIVAMKDSGVWAKRIAYYGFLGGTAVSHAINWRSPGTYNMVWKGNVSHDPSGIRGDGSTGYGDTGIPLNLLNAQNTHMATYNQSNSNCLAGALVNPQNNAFYIEGAALYRSAKGAFNNGNNADARSTTSGQPGYLVGCAVNDPNIFVYKNGADITTSRPSGNPENYNFTASEAIRVLAYYFGSEQGAGTYFSSSSVVLSSFSIGFGLTASQVLADYQAEQAYQSALNRSVK